MPVQLGGNRNQNAWSQMLKSAEQEKSSGRLQHGKATEAAQNAS
jgi:hypothetical protein